MADFTMQRICRLGDWLRVRRLYFSAFPAEERKPFSIIFSMWRKGKSDLWCFRVDGRFAGFASTINGDKLIMIDYLAVSDALRGQRVGTQAMEALCNAYPDKGIFVEIESPYEDGPDRQLRLRRRAFYERCGFTPSRTMADVFGVRFELLGCRCAVDYETYHAFYATQYSAWAAEHIFPAEYPGAGIGNS